LRHELTPMPLSASGGLDGGKSDFRSNGCGSSLVERNPGRLITAAIVGATVAFSYAAFALIGFGGGPLATPFLVLRLPVRMVVPLLAVLDFVAATINLAKSFGARRPRRAEGEGRFSSSQDPDSDHDRWNLRRHSRSEYAAIALRPVGFRHFHLYDHTAQLAG